MNDLVKPDIQSRSYRGIIVRFLVSIVLIWNVQCAIAFLIHPENYAPSFQLSTDLIGVTVVRSLGLLFLMWNIPYIFAAIQPFRWKILPIVILLQQLVAVIGEIWILSFLISEPFIRTSILKFVYFDSAGLILLILAAILIFSKQNPIGEK